MMTTMRATVCGVAAVMLWLAACGGNEGTRDGVAAAEAVAIEQHHECAACGMIVAEQSAPRAQLVHRDGTRQFFCSLGDLRAYLGAPSAHGAVVAVHVELLDPAADPRAFSVEARPWSPAADASFVVGIDKPRVMGAPVMAYATPDAARAVAARYGGQTRTWQALLE